VLEEFLAAESSCSVRRCTIFTISKPAQAWIDRILVAGKNVSNTQPKASRVWPATSASFVRDLARRLLWPGHAGPAVGEHLETLLALGVSASLASRIRNFISADGIQVGPEHREKAVAGALKAASDLNAA